MVKNEVENMLGKKGKVEIQIDYTNNEKQDVDGKELYVPLSLQQEQCYQQKQILILK